MAGLLDFDSEESVDTGRVDLLLDLNSRRFLAGGSVLDSPPVVESVWGDGHRCIWARGEPLLWCGPDAVGKTTVMQQFALKRAGIGEPSLLGFSVHDSGGRVLYLACDRPSQAVRSFHRMVKEADRATLDERLVLWRGPLPFDLAREPEALLALARRAGCDTVILDSVKDVAADLSKEDTGQGLNRAFQSCVADGVEVAGLHHQRKAQAGAGKPRHLADVYGSRWLTAGCGSVVMLWGEAGDPVVEFEHLKQPDETVGPFQVVHDHLTGTSSVVDHVDAYTVVARSSKGVTAAEVASVLFGSDDRLAREKAKRRLDRLTNEGKIHRRAGERGGALSGAKGSLPDRYFPLSLLMPGGADDAA